MPEPVKFWNLFPSAELIYEDATEQLYYFRVTVSQENNPSFSRDAYKDPDPNSINIDDPFGTYVFVMMTYGNIHEPRYSNI